MNRTTTYQYDAKENLTREVRPCNAGCSDMGGSDTYTYSYDANGFQTLATDPSGNTSHEAYNQFGGLLGGQDAANTDSQTISYDANFNPVQITDSITGTPNPLGGTFGPLAGVTYDTNGNVLTYTDANGKTTTFSYDARGNLLTKTDALNRKTTYTYDNMDRVTSKTDPRGLRTTYGYDDLGRMTSMTDALGHTTQFQYDLNGNKVSETVPMSDGVSATTSYEYDGLNRLIKITYPPDVNQTVATKQFVYDFRGNKLSEVDQLGRTTQYVYDLAGDLTSVTYAVGLPEQASVSYTYDKDGQKWTFQDEDGAGHTTTYSYDPVGNLSRTSDSAGNQWDFHYDGDRRLTNKGEINLNYTYDARGRITQVRYPQEYAPETPGYYYGYYTYDGMGHKLTMTDEAGLVTTNAYDDAGQLISVTDAAGAALTPPTQTTYAHDADGNLTQITDENGHITSYQYDSLNRRTQRMLPDGKTETYGYDFAGNMTSKTDFNGETTRYTYDELNRLLSKVPDSSLSEPTVTFSYSETGQRLTMDDASGHTGYAYDNRDRLTQKVTPEGTLNYAYDSHGNVLSIASSYANGASLAYTYYGDNRVKTVADNGMLALGGPGGTSNPTTYFYNHPFGDVAYATFPNSLRVSSAYDGYRRTLETCLAAVSVDCTNSQNQGQKLMDYNYIPAPAGNVTSVTELNNRSVTYGYDNDYRLLSETVASDPGNNNGAESYAYDPVGNRMTLNSTIPALAGGATYAYDQDDRLVGDVYDANGNTINSLDVASTYDFENHMLTHGAGVNLVYDGDGNRVRETVGGVTTQFLIDDRNPTGLTQVMDEVVNGTVTKTYAYGLQRISENQQIGGAWTPSFYGYDGHANVRYLTNAAGAITDTYTYDAFGLPISTTGSTPNAYTYSGERFDQNLGLFHLRARDYNPLTGRFETMDTYVGDILNQATLHKYVYAADNPVNWIDPWGTEIEENEEILEGDEVDEVEARFESLRKYQNSGTTGYRISTEGTEDELDEAIQNFIEQWNAK